MNAGENVALESVTLNRRAFVEGVEPVPEEPAPPLAASRVTVIV